MEDPKAYRDHQVHRRWSASKKKYQASWNIQLSPRAATMKRSMRRFYRILRGELVQSGVQCLRQSTSPVKNLQAVVFSQFPGVIVWKFIVYYNCRNYQDRSRIPAISRSNDFVYAPAPRDLPPLDTIPRKKKNIHRTYKNQGYITLSGSDTTVFPIFLTYLNRKQTTTSVLLEKNEEVAVTWGEGRN